MKAKTYCLYVASTGLFTGQRLQCNEEELLSVRLPAGTIPLEGMFNPSRQRVDLGTEKVVSYTPPGSSAEEERRAMVIARIQALEASQGRALREATLGDPAAMKRLREIDTAISELRAELDLE